MMYGTILLLSAYVESNGGRSLVPVGLLGTVCVLYCASRGFLH